VEFITNWQGEIFRAAIEKGEQLGDAHVALIVVDIWIRRMKSNEANTGTEWDHMDSFARNVLKDSKRRVIFKGYPEHIQVKLWRDTAVQAIIHGDQNTTNAIVELFRKDKVMVKRSFKADVAITHRNRFQDRVIESELLSLLREMANMMNSGYSLELIGM